MPAAAEVVLPYRAHANTWLRIAFTLLGGAVVAAACTAEILALVLGSLAVTPLAVGLVLRAVAGRHERTAAGLLAGDATLRWTIPDAQWRAHVASERRNSRRLGLLMVGLGALAGVGAAAGFAEDGDGIAGSRALAWVLPPLAGALLGFAVAALIRTHQRARFDQMERSQGVFCLGSDGMYLTGCYWPWNDIGVTVRSVDLDADGLLFHFAITEGGQQTVRVPIAPGHEAAARAWVGQVNGG
ncbi:MAG: hypothetical protein JNK15_07905 [Planctomycetes bacterium]|nr:hypothetical protein [Planctomycetota bacterium]